MSVIVGLQKFISFRVLASGRARGKSYENGAELAVVIRAMGGGQWAVGSQKPKAQSSSLLTASNVVKHDLHLVGIEEAVGVVPAGGMEGGEEVGTVAQEAAELVEGGAARGVRKEAQGKLGFVPDVWKSSAQ